MLDASTLLAIAPRFSGDKAVKQAAIVAAVGPVLDATFGQYNIGTPLRQAHFLAQTCVEAAGFRTTVEFADGSEYEGRADLGNTHAGDGPRYKGRGLIQLTGRANYAAYGPSVGLDLVANPDLAADPVVSLKIACEYWHRKELNFFADHDDAISITKRINGGFNGLTDRLGFLATAKTRLGVDATTTVAGYATVQRPGKSLDAFALQANLQQRNYPLHLVDGDFGGGTDTALKAFQTDHGLPANGVAGPEVWAALGLKGAASPGAAANA